MDIPGITKKQIFALVDSVQPQSRYKTLVVDETVQNILSFCLENNELLDRQVANVVILDKPRQAENYLEAMYICEASSYNIDCITADFTRVPHRYSRAHVFLLPGATNSDITKLKTSVVGRHLATLDVANIYLYALERNIFSLGDPYANDRLYNRHVTGPPLKELDTVAFQLASLCEGLGDLPYVRYVSSSGYAGSELPQLLAERVAQYLGKDEDGAASQKRRSTLLILDRSIDVAAPLLHEFTYQAMAYDLLRFNDQNEFKSRDGSVSGRLNEQDVEWVEMRHAHISRVVEELGSRLAELKKSNPHFADTTSDVKVSDIRNMMASLPDYVKSKDRMALNLQIASECMDAVEERHLKVLAATEQAAVLGPDPDEETTLPLPDQFVSLLASKEIDRKARLRLLMLYVIGRGTGLYQEDLERLRKHAGFDQAEIEMVLNLSAFGAAIVKDSKPESSSTPSLISRGNKIKGQPYYSENGDEQLLFARFTPGLKNIAEKLLTNVLDLQSFPYAGEAPDNVGEITDAASSLRNPRQRATWAKTTSTKQVARQRVIVFVLGGITASEMRSVYELSSKHSKDVILGGSDLLTANKFLTFLSRQRLSRQQLQLPEDAKARKAPAFLFESDRQVEQRQQQQQHQQQQQQQQRHNGGQQPHGGDVVLGKQGPPMAKPEKKSRFFGLKRKG